MLPKDETVYRVKLNPATDTLDILLLGMEPIDRLPDGVYTWDDIPEWMRGKLAALSTMYLPPPPTSVENVGQRINERVFWVYA